MTKPRIFFHDGYWWVSAGRSSVRGTDGERPYSIQDIARRWGTILMVLKRPN